ncbi:sulfate ABC transporter permease subunit [Polyangium sp. y55x31]|uniref:sulfate ABC transporter permease subunit n=1 Tax=Polyangium sp. y55x31 TaxID=3042688 RepID=UPI002482AC64|nr:sulfate ABC transporter permease subunit [Polyangium sp. y55x31]MDI1483637.1 sulfate ABC transporter permease subunit [Polyangium sp. y55x31]
MAERAGGGRRHVRALLIGAAVLYVGALVLLPVASLLRGALGGGIRPFAEVLARPDVLSALVMTAKLTAFAVVVNGTLGTALAFVLVRDRFVGKRVMNALVDVPFALSPVAVGVVLLSLFGKGGLLRPITDALGVEIVFAWPAMAMATAFVTLPFVVREVGPVLEEMGTDQELAAYTLGASPFVTFFRVTLPGIRWGLAYGATLTMARAIGEFGAVLLVSGGVAGQTETATVFVYRALEDRDDRGAYVVATVLALASIGLLLLLDVVRRKRGARGQAEG